MTAPSLTISTTQNGTLSLSSDNPVLIAGAGAIAATAAGADAFDRSAGVDWQVANFGAISSTSAQGVNLAGSGDGGNSGSISGRGGCSQR